MHKFGYNVDRDSKGTVFYQKYYIDIRLYIDNLVWIFLLLLAIKIESLKSF